MQKAAGFINRGYTVFNGFNCVLQLNLHMHQLQNFFTVLKRKMLTNVN